MNYSPALVIFVKHRESYRRFAYQDKGGVWTIGYGHTRGIKRGMQCTEAQATTWLMEDLDEAARIVNQAVAPVLKQYQFDALVSFVFNVGPGKKGEKAGFQFLKSGEPSTMLVYLNSGLISAAATQFERWINIDGVPSPGLRNRRIMERDMFNDRMMVA